MIKILNSELDVEIEINYDGLIITLKDYEENPFVKIELDGVLLGDLRFDFIELDKLFNSFGKYTNTWFLYFNTKLLRIDTQFFYHNKYGENSYQQIDGNDGTKTLITFKLHEFQTEIESLKKQSDFYVRNEDYRKADEIAKLIEVEENKMKLNKLLQDLQIIFNDI